MTGEMADPSAEPDDEPPAAVTDRSPSDDRDLRSSLADLAQLALGPGQQGLEQMLTLVAQYAVRAIPEPTARG